MSKRHGVFVLGIATSSLLVQSAIAQHQHEGDLIVGISGAANPQLKFEFDEDILAGLEFVNVPAIANPAIQGWLGDEPGFEALEADEPDEGFFMLGSGAQIRLVGVDLDPGLFVRSASIGTPVRISPSPTLGYLTLGDHELHTHAVWHIDSSAPGYQPRTAWYGTFKLQDVGTTGYAESEPFTIGFVPEPASIGLLAIGALPACGRRRSRGGMA